MNYIFWILFTCFLGSFASAADTNDDLHLIYLSDPSPVEIKISFAYKKIARAEKKKIYQSLKDDFQRSEDSQHIVFDDKNLAITFLLDPFEVESCFLRTTYGEKNGIGNPFNHLSINVLYDDQLCLRPTISVLAVDYLVWTLESRRVTQLVRNALLEAAKAHNERAIAQPVYLEEEFKAKPSKLILKLLTTHQGVVVGECFHDDTVAKTLLKKSMKKMAKEGVRAIFLEHLTYDTMKGALEYAAEKKDAQFIPSRIRYYLQKLDDAFAPIGEKPGFLSLVETAVKYGITVIPIDTTHSRLMGWTREKGIDNDAHRMLGMNFVAANIVKLWQGKYPDARFVILAGCCHATTYQDENGQRITGLSEQLAIPSVFVAGTGNSKSEIKFNTVPEEALDKLDQFSAVLRINKKK